MILSYIESVEAITPFRMPLYQAISKRTESDYSHNTIRHGVTQLIYSYEIHYCYLVAIVRKILCLLSLMV